MKLSLKNIGKLKEATIEINGLTVIAGENNTGKSTVGKALYSMLTVICELDHEINSGGFKQGLTNQINSVFNGKINTLYTEKVGEITLTIKNNQIYTELLNNEVKSTSEIPNLKVESVYLYNGFNIDEVKDGSTVYFQDSYLNEIFEAVGLNSDYNEFTVRNLSTGLKIFLDIKTLLENGTLKEKSTLILDGPEAYLHPTWQILFAELIVLLQKKMGIHILLNTHSPYFLDAIETYGIRYGISEKCNYYLASNIDETSAVIKEVTNNLELIYRELARPLQTLENMRYEEDGPMPT